MRPFLGQEGIVASDQALAGELRRGDRGQVLLIEQRQLQVLVRDQLADGRRLEGGDPAQLRVLAQLVDAGLGQQAAVADQDHAGQPKAASELVQLVGQGRGVAGVSMPNELSSKVPK